MLISHQSVGQRRGHKYKHSSVSHQIFLEPAPRAPISLPNSLPIPTIRECWKSMSRDQSIRFYWSICHITIAAFTLGHAEGSLALTSLSHLLLYDSFGAIICGMVDVFSNFEVWKRSSIRHPFGLERAEVLAGFAMSVLLVFMGIDLISHNVQHMLEGVGSHEPHHSHSGHSNIPRHAINASAFFAILATTVSARVLDNHARIGKVMRIGYFSNLPSILSNPSHFLTITCSFCLFLLPHTSIHLYKYMDHILSCTIAVCMSSFGVRIVMKLGKMLLMTWTPSINHSSSSSSSTSTSKSKSKSNKETAPDPLVSLISTIESDPLVSCVEAAKVWQVHYGLCMANLKLRVRGGSSSSGSRGGGGGGGGGEEADENLTRLRDRLANLVRNKLGGGYGSGAGVRWEVTAQLEKEKEKGVVGAGAGAGAGASPLMLPPLLPSLLMLPPTQKSRMSAAAGRTGSQLSLSALGPGLEKVDGKAL